jgi:ankyrin repeat protein
LLHAAESGSVEIVEKLVDAGAEYFAMMADGFTILHLAAQNGHARVIEFIMQRSMQTNQELMIRRWAESMNTFHETVHHIAAKNGYTEVIDVLGNFGVNVNQLVFQHEPSPLYYAISNGHIEAVKCLIKLGAEVNANPSYHSNFEPPFMLACKKGNIEIIKILIEAKAETNLVGWDSGTVTSPVTSNITKFINLVINLPDF